MSKLFDRQIRITLATEDGREAQITTPKTGRKPAIYLSGTWIPSEVATNIMLRIVNFYTAFPLDLYRYVSIEAGYAGVLQPVCRGEILHSYEETPGPDGVTAFEILIGYVEELLEATISLEHREGTKFSLILDQVAKVLNMTAVNYCPENLTVTTSFSFQGKARNALHKLSYIFKGMVIRPDGTELIAYMENVGTK